MTPIPSADAALLQSEHTAVQALKQLVQLWYAEAGLHGMLRSLDATLAQCNAIRDEFAGDGAGRLEAERGAISQHLCFMLELCAD